MEIFSSLVLARKILTRAPKFPVLGLLWTNRITEVINSVTQHPNLIVELTSLRNFLLKKETNVICNRTNVTTAQECFMMGGGKAQHLTESLGQRDNGLFQQLGVSAEWKKERSVRGQADDSV